MAVGDKLTVTDLLVSFDAKSLFHMALPQDLRVGATLHNQGSVVMVQWRGDTLLVYFDINSVYKVELGADGVLVATCECGRLWRSPQGGACSHIVATLMSLIHVVRPDYFRVPHETQSRVETDRVIKQILFHAMQRFALGLDLHGKTATFVLLADEGCITPDHPLFPDTYSPYFYKPLGVFGPDPSPFWEFVLSSLGTECLVVEEEDTSYPVLIHPEPITDLKVSLHIVASRIEFRALDEGFWLGNVACFNQKQKILAPLKVDSVVLNFVDAIRFNPNLLVGDSYTYFFRRDSERFWKTSTVKFSRHTFNAQSPMIGESDFGSLSQAIQLYAKKEVVTPAIRPLSVRLNFEQHGEKFRVRIHIEPVELCARLDVEGFLNDLVFPYKYSKSDRQRLSRLLWGFVESSFGGDIDEFWRQLPLYAGAWKSELKILSQEPLYRLNGVEFSWVWIKMWVPQLVAPYALLYHYFGIIPFSKPSYLDSEAFFGVLAQLQASCDTFGIQLCMDGMLLETVDLDMDITLTEEDDWFHVAPQFLINGIPLKSEQLQRLLEGDSLISVPGAVFRLSQASRDKLGLVRTLYRLQHRSSTRREVYPIPRLWALDWVALRQHGVSVTLPPEAQQRLQNLITLSAIPECGIPDSCHVRLRGYQQHGVDWLFFMYQQRLGAVLADDMGLGKTVQALVFLSLVSAELAGIVRFLVVVPTSLVYNWRHECRQFCPGFRVVEFSKQTDLKVLDETDILLVTYDQLRVHHGAFSQVQFDVVIFDEAHYLKNVFAARAKAARAIHAKFRVCLTGTPLENNVGDYFSVIDLAIPGLLGTYTEFKEDEKQGRIDTLIRRTKPFVLRRTKDEILTELPSKSEVDTYLDMSALQQRLYVNVANASRAQVAEAFRSTTAARAGVVALTALLRLRQICVSPRLVSDTEPEASPKLDFLQHALSDLILEGHSALVFSQFRKALDVIELMLKANNIPYVRMDGATPLARRKKYVDEFQNTATPLVFLISLKTGGVGLNLTKASYVFHVEPWWNPAVENQASDRAHRIGQTKCVMIHRLIMSHTLEEKMMTLKQKKGSLFQKVMTFGSVSDKGSITADEFSYLLDAGDLAECSF